MKTRLRSVAFVAAAGGMAVSSAAWAETLWPSQVSLIGVNVIPYDTTYGGTPVGGLSGLDYDTATGGYIAISDDRSQLAPARFYDMQIPVTSTTLGPVTFTGVTKFTDGSGATYAARTIDPESIRFSPSGGIVWSSEGDATLGINTSVRRATIGGETTAQFLPPSYYAPTATSGIRNNLAFEGLTYTPDGSLYAGMENALIQDGPDISTTIGSPSRILKMNATTGAALAEYVYENDPIPFSPNPPGAYSDNGVSEILALDDTHFLVIERAFAIGVGFSIRLYEADLDGATDVLGASSLEGLAYEPMTKRLIADFGKDFGFAPDNVEGMTFGPALANGDRTLMLIVDNNFASDEAQQVIALRIAPVPEPSTWALLTLGFAGLGLAGFRARQTRISFPLIAIPMLVIRTRASHSSY